MNPSKLDLSKIIKLPIEDPVLSSINPKGKFVFQVFFSDLFLSHFSPMILNTYKKGLSCVPSENSTIEMKKYAQNLQASVEAFKKALAAWKNVHQRSIRF